MKICDLTQSYTPKSGGIKTYIHEKRKFILNNTDYEHILIVPGEKDSFNKNGRSSLYEIAAPFIPGCEPYRALLNLEKVGAILEETRPDVIELGCAYALPWAAFSYRKRFPKTVVVGFYHTDFPATYAETTVKSLFGNKTAFTAKLIASRYAAMVYNKFDLALAPSVMLMETMKKYGIKKVEYIPLGVDTFLFSPSRRDDSIRERLGIGKKDLMLVYSGRLDIEKRVNVIIEAFKKIPVEYNARLVLIGDGPLREDIEKESESINGRLKVISYIEEKIHLACILASSDIYVTAGPFETFGLSVLEGQSSGLPVVGVASGALLERVDSSTGILGKVDSSNDMARNMMALAANGYREKGMAARRIVEQNYSWEKSFEKLLNIYKDICYNSKDRL